MKFKEAFNFLIPKLEQDLPVYLTYHNAQHTKDVLQAAEYLCKAENVTAHEKELLLAAALFHDSGFMKTYDGHEEQSCEIAKEALPNFGYSKEDIDAICDLIMATRLAHKPTTLLQKIIRDADLHYLGTDHYFEIANKLYSEYKHQGFVKDHRDWHHKQITFLEEHEYLTSSANKKYGLIKKKNLQLLAIKKKSEEAYK